MVSYHANLCSCFVFIQKPYVNNIPKIMLTPLDSTSFEVDWHEVWCLWVHISDCFFDAIRVCQWPWHRQLSPPWRHHQCWKVNTLNAAIQMMSSSMTLQTRPHSARLRTAWLSAKTVWVQGWSACMPDLSPITNLPHYEGKSITTKTRNFLRHVTRTLCSKIIKHP